MRQTQHRQRAKWPFLEKFNKNKGQTRLVVHCLTFAFNNNFLLLNLSFVFGKKGFIYHPTPR